MKAGREERLAQVNALVEVIAGCGRRFFHHKGRVARMEVNECRGATVGFGCYVDLTALRSRLASVSSPDQGKTSGVQGGGE